MINERLKSLRDAMKKEGISWCMIPTCDYHGSEYLADFFKVRDYFSGFTGSAGTLVVGPSEAFLFTDGRYFIQAAKQLEGSLIKLMKMGEPGVPKVTELIINSIEEGQKLGFDGRVVDSETGLILEEGLKDKNCSVIYDFDPTKGIWNERPTLVYNCPFILDEKIAGESVASKLERIRTKMDEKGVDTHIITALDDIAWILNMRGKDVENNPVFFSFLTITKDNVVLYANILDEDILSYLEKNNIELQKYDDFFEKGIQRVNICTKEGLLLDKTGTSYKIIKAINSSIRIVDELNISTYMKAIKNKAEIENIKIANIKDGAAVVRFDRWLKSAIDNNEKLTEMTVSQKLASFREENESYIEPSFDTIAAFGYHGAIVHYEPTEQTDIPIGRDSFLLIDSGGQYAEGTTDVTRTYGIGEVASKLKHDYTLVLKANLKLLNFKFMKGCRGNHLDVVARDFFWSEGRDYKHGTGHGIGALLNVHEGPNSIRWNIPEGKQPGVIYEPGMVTSDEPGIYIENEYGIRTETDMLCVELETNEYGTFYGFEPLTYVPIDKKPIEIEYMSDQEIKWLNDYHMVVREKLSPMLQGDDLDYLIDVTSPISK